MRKLIHGSAITGRERGVIAAYSGLLKEAKWTSLVNGSNPTHTGVQRQNPRTGLFDIATRFPKDDTTGVRNYITIPKYHDWRTGGTIAITMRSMSLGGAANRYISTGFGNAAGNTWYQIYLGPTNILWTYFNAATNTGYTMPLYKWVRIVLTWTSTALWVYVDGNQQVTVPGLVLPSDINAASNMLGQADGANNLAEWDVADFSQFSTTMTADEAKQDYLRYSRRIQWAEDFDAYRVSSADQITAFVGESPWIINPVNGQKFRFVDATINGRQTKSLKCVQAGLIYIPVQYLGFEALSPEVAYGTYEFYFKKAAATAPIVHFTTTTVSTATSTGYALAMAADETVSLRRYTGGAVAATPFASAAGAMAEATWTKFRVARRYNGRFSIYKDDVLMVAAAGANPCTDTTHTTGSYFLLDMGAGDEIALVSKRFGECL